MKRSLAPYLRAYRSVPCPRCGAEAGRRCRTPRGNFAYTHGARSDLVQLAFRIGVEDGLAEALGFIEAGRPEMISRQLAWMQGSNARAEQARTEGGAA